MQHLMELLPEVVLPFLPRFVTVLYYLRQPRLQAHDGLLISYA